MSAMDRLTTEAGQLRVLVSVTVVVFCVLTLPHQAAPAGDVELSGLVDIGTVRYAALRILDEAAPAAWRKEGETVGIYTIAEIRSDSVLLRRAGGETVSRERVIHLKHAIILASVDSPAEAMSEERIRWINSSDNPMANGPYLPDELLACWTDLSQEEKVQFYGWWMAHGWRPIVTVLGKGEIEFVFQPVHRGRSRGMAAAHYQRFVESLSEPQRELLDRFKELSVLMPDDPNPAATEAEGEKREAAFKASLSVEQAELFRKLSESPHELLAPEESNTIAR